MVRIVGMPSDESMFDPPGQGRFVDIEARSRFPFAQHSAISQSIVARTESVAMDEIGNPQGSEAVIAAATPRRSTRAISLLVEKFGNLGIDKFVEELVDQLDDTWLRLHLLRRRLGVRCGERLGFATLEADVNLRGSFRRHFGEGDILDDVGKQSFAFAVWRIRICQSLLKSTVIAMNRSRIASSRIS